MRNNFIYLCFINRKNHIYFAGDFHLGAPSYKESLEREKLICTWLDEIKDNATEIFLMGDIFDFWFEYKHIIPKGFVRLQGKLAELTDSGIEITTFKGNHDMWTFGYLEKELGLNVVSDELIIERNGKKIYMHHGDGLGPGDQSYKFLKKIFRSKVLQWAFARLHPNFAIGVANFFSKNSRIQNNKNPLGYQGDDKEILTLFANEYLKKEKIDFFVFGHRHLVYKISLNNGAKCINTGEWVTSQSYALFDGQDIILNNFFNKPIA